MYVSGMGYEDACWYMNSKPYNCFKIVRETGVEAYVRAVRRFVEPAYLNMGFAEAKGRYVPQALTFGKGSAGNGSITAPSATDPESGEVSLCSLTCNARFWRFFQGLRKVRE